MYINYIPSATHGVVLVILVERMTSAIATSARITSAYFRAHNRVHCYCSGITIFKDYSTLGVHYRDLQARVHEQETRNLTLHEATVEE